MTVEEFYRLLFCPACKGDLTLQNAATQFYCSACSYTFPIIDGIPVLMPCNVVENMDRLFGRAEIQVAYINILHRNLLAA